MIHTLLNITRPLYILDTETTGLDTQKDRIIELGFQRWDATGMTLEWRALVNPGIPIPPAATKVHHITDEMVQACQTCGGHHTAHTPAHDIGDKVCFDYKPHYTFRQLAPNLAKGFVDCDFCGQNCRYDLRILAAEFARAGIPWSYAGARIIDSSRIEALAVPRHLSDLYEKYVGHICKTCGDAGSVGTGIHDSCLSNSHPFVPTKHDGAHGALSDVRAAATVIARQLETYPDLPRDIDALHEAQWPGVIDPDMKFRFVDGVPCFSQWGKYAGQPMRDADVGYWDFILRGTFSADVKALASAAKLGKFP